MFTEFLLHNMHKRDDEFNFLFVKVQLQLKLLSDTFDYTSDTFRKYRVATLTGQKATTSHLNKN